MGVLGAFPWPAAPYLIAASPASYPEVREMVAMRDDRPGHESEIRQIGWAFALGVVGSAAAALYLGASCFLEFDAAVNRPRRPPAPIPGPAQAGPGDDPDEGCDERCQARPPGLALDPPGPGRALG